MHLNTKIIGRENTCDLILEHSTASRFHARLELSRDGRLSVLDSDSRNGTFLHRNDGWIRIKKASLCVGDLIRFGEYEVPLQQLSAIFGKSAAIKLGAKHFSLRRGNKNAGRLAGWDDDSPSMQKPRRNPLTGKIEEERK
jgi:pSer/pThr/pTyr-binding forkhead associated (FHA) protein